MRKIKREVAELKPNKIILLLVPTRLHGIRVYAPEQRAKAEIYASAMKSHIIEYSKGKLPYERI